MNQINDLLILVVVYNKEPGTSAAIQSIESIRSNNDLSFKVLIHDNSKNSSKSFEALNFLYKNNPSNVGVSGAYNSACEVAEKRGCSWMLLLDQDTSFDNSLLNEFLHHRDGADVCVPQVYYQNKKMSPSSKSFINSGLFVSIATFKSVGGYNERLRLDYTDVDFSNRLHQSSARFVELDARLDHQLDFYRYSLEEAMHRFLIFLEDASAFKDISGKKLRVFKDVFLRAIKLTMVHRTLWFLKKVLSGG